MSIDITPSIAPGRQLVQSYGGMRFRIAGQVHEGSVLILPERTIAWAARDVGGITAESLAPVLAAVAATGILVVGCGPAFQPPPGGLGQSLKDRGLALEWMDTGAACRTFNVLLVEDRICAAALIAVE
jgi:uncharacterized protein